MSRPEPSYPDWRNTVPIRVDLPTLRLAEQRIESCEACTPDAAEIPFDFLLDELTGCDPEVTDYVLPQPARCPRCFSPIRTGYWRWYTCQDNARKVFVLPGTLVSLKNE